METFTRAEIAKIGKWVKMWHFCMRYDIFDSHCDCGCDDPCLTIKQRSLLYDIESIAGEIEKLGEWMYHFKCETCGVSATYPQPGDMLERRWCSFCTNAHRREDMRKALDGDPEAIERLSKPVYGAKG